MEIDVKFYSAIIILAHLAFLGWFIIHRREYFSVRGIFLLYATTWIFGCVAVENGFFAYAPNRVADCYNGSSLVLMLGIWGTYIVSRLRFSWSTRSRQSLLADHEPDVARGHSEYQLTALLGLGCIVWLIFLILRAGAPLFAPNKDLARAALWVDTLSPYLQRLYTIFIPALITLSYLLWAQSCQKKFRPVLLYLNIAGFALLCILIVQRAAALQILVPIMIAVHYANFMRMKRGRLTVFRQKKVILLTTLLVVFMIWGTSLYLQTSLSEGFRYFWQRLTVGQGESFWRVYYDWIDKEKEPPLSFSGLDRFSYVMFRSGVLGVMDPERDKTDMFGPWVTGKLTSSTYWNTSYYNLTINYLGEGAIFFGSWGMAVWTILAGLVLSLFHRAVRNKFLRNDFYRGTFIIIFYKVQITSWINMGGFANVFKLSEMGYFIILLGVLAFIRSSSSLCLRSRHSPAYPAISS